MPSFAPRAVSHVAPEAGRRKFQVSEVFGQTGPKVRPHQAALSCPHKNQSALISTPIEGRKIIA